MEDLRMIVCIDEADADAEHARCQAALQGANVRVTKRKIQDLPLMPPVNCKQGAFTYSVQVSNNLLECWVVCVEVN